VVKRPFWKYSFPSWVVKKHIDVGGIFLIASTTTLSSGVYSFSVFTPEESSVFWRLREEGLSDRKIAERTGLSVCTVHRLAYQ